MFVTFHHTIEWKVLSHIFMVYKKDYEGYENNNIHNNKDNVEFK